MFGNFSGYIYIERVKHYLANTPGPHREKQQCATDAVNYLIDIGYTKSPYWQEFLAESDLHGVPEVDEPAEGESLAIQKAIAHKYVDAISVLEAIKVHPLKHYQYLERIVQLLVLANNYKGLEELDYRLNAIPTSYDSLPSEELRALRRIRLIICSSFYLKGSHFDCCKSFFKLLDSESNIQEELSTVNHDQFITNDEILLMITISAILAIPCDNYDDFLYIQNLEKFGDMFSGLIECLKLLINTSFGRFFSIWDGEYDKKCKESMFLNRSWSSAKYMMRSKIYFFYMRVSNKLEISYLSRILHIDKDIIEREIRQLIISAHLNFEQKDDLIVYRPKHYLNDVVLTLRENQAIITQKLNGQASKNQALKDVVQDMIVKNNAQTVESVKPSGEETLMQRPAKLFRSLDIMDVDEINDISDIDSASFEVGN